MSLKFWYYKINAREGDRGFADDVEFKSKNFDSFEECFKSYIIFNPAKHWRYFRYIQSEDFVYINNNVEHVNKAREGMLFYKNIENELGITDCEFDKIINDINKK